MRTFQDAAGRTWALSVSVTSLRTVRDRLGLDLNRVISFEPTNEKNPFPYVQTFFADSIAVADVLWVLIEPQAATVHKIGQEAFEGGLTGDALDAAGKALYQALADYCPEAPRRHALKKMAELVARMERASIEQIDGAALEDLTLPPNESTNTSPSLPAYSESTPAPSLGANWSS
jgi:hypothetical protein